MRCARRIILIVVPANGRCERQIFARTHLRAEINTEAGRFAAIDSEAQRNCRDRILLNVRPLIVVDRKIHKENVVDLFFDADFIRPERFRTE